MTIKLDKLIEQVQIINIMQKVKQEKIEEGITRTTLDWIVREGLFEEVTFKQRLKY